MTEAGAVSGTAYPAGASLSGLLLGRGTLLRIPVYVWLAVLVLAPNILLVVTSFMSSQSGVVVYAPTLKNYLSIFTSWTVQLLTLKTLAVSAIAAVVATAVAYPLAYYVSRKLSRGKQIAALMIVIPLWISLLMRIFAWRVILGEHGILNGLLLSTGVVDEPSALFLYNPVAVVFTMTSILIPYVFISAFTAIERVPFSLVEAARDNGASAYRTFTTVVWPLTREGTGIGLALAFLMAVGDFVTPSMVGGLNGTMLGMVISSQFGMGANWPLGAAISVYLLVLVAIVLGLLVRFTRSRGVLTEVDAGAPAQIAPWKDLTGRDRLLRVVGRILFVLPYIYLYAPLVVITLFSFNDSTVQSLPFSGFTWKWYAALPDDRALIGAVWLTFKLALIVTVIGTVVATAFAFVLAGWRGPGSSLIEKLVALPVAVPGVVLGISMVMIATLAGIAPGLGRLLLGHIVFVMPVVLLVILARLRRIDESYALASRDLGAGWWSTFVRIQFPMISSAVIGGALLGFTLSVDEVMVSLFLTGTEPTLPVYVWNQTRFGFTPSVNAIFTVIGVISLVLVIASQALLRSNPRQAH